MTCTLECKSHVTDFIINLSNCIHKHSGMPDTNITKNAYKAVVSKFEGKRTLGRSRPRLHNIN